MFTVSVRERFAAAHRLVGMDENLHGHTYAVSVSVAKPKLNSEGIAYDFRNLKQTLRKIIGQLDHRYLNELKIFSKKEPTAENIAVFVYEEFQSALPEARIQSVEVAESENAKVIYKKTKENE